MNIIRNSIFDILMALLLFVLIAIHLDVNIFHYCTQMDADIASEAVLVTDLAENGGIVPETWFSSTEKRVISSPNLGVFIYYLVGENMNLSIGIACNIMMIVLIIVMAIFLNNIGFDRREILSALILLLSLSNFHKENQSMLFLWAGYYVSNFITLFIMLILMKRCITAKKVSAKIYCISIILAVANGLQGMRGCLYCYVPILGTEIIRRIIIAAKGRKEESHTISNKRENGITLWVVLMAIINLVIAKLFGPYSLGGSRNIRHAGEKLFEEVLPAINDVINYNLVAVVIIVICILAIIGYVIMVYRTTTNKTTWNNNEDLFVLTLAPVVSFAICALSLIFTTIEVAPRYFITELFIVAIGMALFIHMSQRRIKGLVSLIVVIIGIMAPIYYYDGLIIQDKSTNTDEYRVAQWMQDNGYQNGYATFDFANSITVYSNNKVKVRSVNSMKELEGCKWLTDSRWYPPVKSAERETCYIVTEHSEPDLKAFIYDNSANVIVTDKVGKFTIYLLDHDYTVWER